MKDPSVRLFDLLTDPDLESFLFLLFSQFVLNWNFQILVAKRNYIPLHI